MPAISRDGAAGTGSLYKGSRKSVLNSDRCPLDTFRFAKNLRLTVSEMLVNVKNLSARDLFVNLAFPMYTSQRRKGHSSLLGIFRSCLLSKKIIINYKLSLGQSTVSRSRMLLIRKAEVVILNFFMLD